MLPACWGRAVRPLLEQLLTMPRSRLLVDGYNVSKSAWGQSALEAQRQRLLRSLAPLVARTGAETTVVFDAANLTSRPVVAAPRGVKVVFSPPGVIADDVIRDLVAAEPPGRTVVVVTDDQEVIRDARAAGARVASASALVALLGALAALAFRCAGISAARGLGRRPLAGAGSRLAGGRGGASAAQPSLLLGPPAAAAAKPF